jgi:hypothetical protein
MKKTDIINEAMALLWPGEKPHVDCRLRLHHALNNALTEIYTEIARRNSMYFEGVMGEVNGEPLLPRHIQGRLRFGCAAWYCADYWQELPNQTVIRCQTLWKEARADVLHGCQGICLKKIGGLVDVRV